MSTLDFLQQSWNKVEEPAQLQGSEREGEEV